MNDIDEFFVAHESEILKIISTLPRFFSSYDFHKKFRKKFEKEYVLMLYVEGGKGSKGIFQRVHSAIGNHLRDNSQNYNIHKLSKKEGREIDRVERENVFGDKESEAQIWKKIKITS